MERTEDLQLNGLKILRRDDLPGYTTDSVLLADFVRIRPGLEICDLGTGTGIIPLLLLGRQPKINVTGIEIDSGLADLAAQSARLNFLESRLQVIHGDLRDIQKLALPKTFDMIVSNPPYFLGTQGGAHSHQHTCMLENVIIAAKYLLKPGGYFYTCCPADSIFLMSDTMRAQKIEPKCIRFVTSRAKKSPYLVLIRGKLGAKTGLTVMPQLVILNHSDQYTDELRAIYHIEYEEESCYL